MYLNFRQDSKFFVNFYVKFRQYIFRLEYLKKSRDQLKIMNALLDKIFFRLQIIYDNLLKSSKTLKEIKTYFIYVNNCHKVTQETREKKKIQKINKLIRFHTSRKFISFFSRLIYMFQLFASPRRIINYRK